MKKSTMKHCNHFTSHTVWKTMINWIKASVYPLLLHNDWMVVFFSGHVDWWWTEKIYCLARKCLHVWSMHGVIHRIRILIKILGWCFIHEINSLNIYERKMMSLLVAIINTSINFGIIFSKTITSHFFLRYFFIHLSEFFFHT